MSNSILAITYTIATLQHKMANSNAHGTTNRRILDEDVDHHACSKLGCFPTLFKKIHPANSPTVKSPN